jgi:uncharacterized protein (TIRG00374 family)
MYRKISAIVLSTLIAAAIIIFMLARVWDDLILALEHADWIYLLAATAVCIAAWFLRGFRYQKILAGLDIPVGLYFSTACIFVSQTANLIIPARLGDLVRVFILKHEYDATISEGISSIVVERVFDIVTVAMLGAVSLLFVIDAPDWFYTLIILPLVAGVIFFGFLLFVGKFSAKNRYLKIILTMLEQIRQASLTFRAMVVLTTESIIIWMFDVAVCFFVVMMFGESIPFALIVLAIVIGNLVKAVPLTPGGVGTYELAVALTFSLAGVSPAVATLIAVIDHLLKNLVTLAGGIVSIYYFGGWVVDTMKSAFRKELSGGNEPGV